MSYELRIYGLYNKGQPFAMQLHPSHTYAQAIEALEATARLVPLTVAVDLNSDHMERPANLATCYAGVVCEFFVCQVCQGRGAAHPHATYDKRCTCNFPRPLVRQLTPTQGG